MAQLLTDDEKLLIRRAYDKLELCDKRYTQTCTGFLNEREQDVLISAINGIEESRRAFCGGYESADRRMLIFIPEYSELDAEELIGCIRCEYYKDYELTHRDFLGALMGLGIERQTVGDIIINKEACTADIVVKRDIIPFLLSDFISAGRARLKVSEINLNELEKIALRTETVTDTVLSPRLDAIVAAGFGMSRENATTLVKSGKVYLNRCMISSPDKTVDDNSLINAQGYGKFKVYITDRLSKKGRTFIKIEKYV